MTDMPRLLVVDDQESMRMLLCSALRGLGYTQMQSVANGREALDALKQGRPADLVLMDVEMPVMNGFDTLKAMRENPALEAISVIMVTSRADANFVRAVMPLQIAGYLVKPVTAAALKVCVDRALSPKRHTVTL